MFKNKEKPVQFFEILFSDGSCLKSNDFKSYIDEKGTIFEDVTINNLIDFKKREIEFNKVVNRNG